MARIRTRYRIFTVCLILLLSLSAGVFFAVALNKTGLSYEEAGRDSLITAKKTFLRDTINNLIQDIDGTREGYYSYYRDLLISAEGLLIDYYNTDPENFVAKAGNLFSSKSYRDALRLLVFKNTGELEYSSQPDTDYQSIAAARLDLLSKKQNTTGFVLGEYQVMIWACNDAINTSVKELIATKIHSFKFDNDVYIWVNEVVNFEGGDDYAIRRVHPNLKDTEGTYLSTNMQDMAGNFPYLEELNGIKQNGEIFFTYFFKKKNSDVISEKLSYAKLYEPYNWIIATGIHLDDVEAMITTSQKQADRSSIFFIITVLAAASVATVLGWLGFSLLDRWYYSMRSSELRHQANSDALTLLSNRRSGNAYMTEIFREFKKGSASPALFMLDLDRFKDVNDTYGHETGDLVLKKFAETVQTSIRSSDIFFRWGGEEFLLVCNGLRPENAVHFGAKLLAIVSNTAIDISGHEPIHITFSAGVAFFSREDNSFDESIRRADKAMFHAKKNGRAMVCRHVDDSNDDEYSCEKPFHQ